MFGFLEGRIVFGSGEDEKLLAELCSEMNRSCRKIFAGSVSRGEILRKNFPEPWAKALAAADSWLKNAPSALASSCYRKAAGLRATASASAKHSRKNLKAMIAGLDRKIASAEKAAKSAKAPSASENPFSKANAQASGKPCGKKKHAHPMERLAKLKERRSRLAGRLARTEAEIAAGRESLCFGGAGLLSQRSRLGDEDSPWKDAEELREEWERRRNLNWLVDGVPHQGATRQSSILRPES